MTKEIKASIKEIIKDIEKAFPDKHIIITVCEANKRNVVKHIRK